MQSAMSRHGNCHRRAFRFRAIFAALGLLAVGAGTGAAGAQSRAVVFDSFVGDLPGCRESAAFRAFTEALQQRYGQSPYDTTGPIEGRSGVRLSLPAAIEPGIGRATATGHGEYAAVVVPAKGTYQGFTVTGFEFRFGQQSSVHSMAIWLDAPLARVQARFAAAFRRAEARARREDSPASAAASGKDGEVLVMCDSTF